MLFSFIRNYYSKKTVIPNIDLEPISAICSEFHFLESKLSKCLAENSTCKIQDCYWSVLLLMKQLQASMSLKCRPYSNVIVCSILALATLSASHAWAQTGSDGLVQRRGINPPLFSTTTENLSEFDNTPVELELRAPFSLIDSERDKTKNYAGQVLVRDSDNELTQLDAKFSARGNWRLQSEQCQFAQLWLDFKKAQVADTFFEGQNKIKLVVQCGDNSRSKKYLLKEYLAYQLFESFSPLHLRTRLLNVTYRDTEDPGLVRTQLAFVIEHHKSLSEQVGMNLVKSSEIDPARLDPLQTNLVALFGYLLGNTDFSFFRGPENEACCHNMKILEDGQGNYLPVPYDFDNTGFVDSEYAAGPSPNIDIRSNKQRTFRGLCMHTPELLQAIEVVLKAQPQITARIAGQAHLSRRTFKSTERFVRRFFQTLDSHEAVEEELINDCRYPNLKNT